GTLVDPVTLTASTTTGFDPLSVNFQAAANAPGTVQDVQYDFNGDNATELTRTDFAGVSHTYNAGTYFPLVTVHTTVGSFSSLGGWNCPGVPLTINVNPSPQTTYLSVT